MCLSLLIFVNFFPKHKWTTLLGGASALSAFQQVQKYPITVELAVPCHNTWSLQTTTAQTALTIITMLV
jgi:hypothetical protein